MLMYEIAQMDSFEHTYGWMYWTWQTESAHQWSYKKGLEAGILPQNAAKRDWDCGKDVPVFADLGLEESY